MLSVPQNLWPIASNSFKGLRHCYLIRVSNNTSRKRSQLHRILAENTWIFGEHFNLTVDDQSLTNVLRKHARVFGSDLVIDRPVTKVGGSQGIVDLMMSRVETGSSEYG